LHRLSSTFILGYHGCDRKIGERLLRGEPFKPSTNEYDWLGPGIYFWEANPLRGLEFAREAAQRKDSRIEKPFVIGAVIELGLCLDLTTSGGIEWVRDAYIKLVEVFRAADLALPENRVSGLRRNLDCAVIRQLHQAIRDKGLDPIDTAKGVFTEGGPIYAGAGFNEKTHVQIAVCNPACIKGVFRVPARELEPVTK
jgi:hypothetical protein